MTRREEAIEFVKKCGYTHPGVAERIVDEWGEEHLLADKAHRIAVGEEPYYKEKTESSLTPVVYNPK